MSERPDRFTHPQALIDALDADLTLTNEAYESALNELARANESNEVASRQIADLTERAEKAERERDRMREALRNVRADIQVAIEADGPFHRAYEFNRVAAVVVQQIDAVLAVDEMCDFIPTPEMRGEAPLAVDTAEEGKHRKFRAVCRGSLSPPDHLFHYPGERPDICKFCHLDAADKDNGETCDEACHDEGKCSGYCAGDGDALAVPAAADVPLDDRGRLPRNYAGVAKLVAAVMALIAQAAEPFLVPDVTPPGWGTPMVFHILRDLVDAGALTHGTDGYRRADGAFAVKDNE